MSWTSELLNLYERHEDEAGVISGKAPVLLPVAHVSLKATTDVCISESGDFVTAKRLEKGEETTIVPVTIDSATRGSGIFPMPLHDKLIYTAGDYDTVSKTSGSDYHKAYMEQLDAWCQDSSCPEHVRAVYAYLKKGTLVKDLMASEAFGKPEDFIRFAVVDENGEIDRLYENRAVMQSWISYYTGSLTEQGIDSITGKMTAVSGKQPNSVRYPGDKAKIISANDKQGFTYRGIFKEASDAATVGYVESQKVHNALRWIIAKQGWRNQSEAYACFSNDDIPLPDLSEGSFDFVSTANLPIDTTSEDYAHRLRQAVHGYEQNLNPDSKVVIIGVDTADGAGQGRLAITYYDEQAGASFFQNIEMWYSDCRWVKKRWTEDKKLYYSEETPSLYEIAVAVYGTPSGDRIMVDDHAVKRLTKRLIPCITEGRPLPQDLVSAAVRNASRPYVYTQNNQERLLFATLALVRKTIKEKKKGAEPMALDRNRKDRDYLFGRLLAVYDHIESRSLYLEKKDRETNAIKLWSSYVATPARITDLLEQKTAGYLSKLSGGARAFYASLKGEIINALAETNAFNNRPLGEAYLLGYYAQREELRTRKNDNLNEEGEKNELQN